VVSLGRDRSFVIADIPGVIEGAAGGAGLGMRFLKHLARTRLLLHLVDIAPLDERVDPAEQVRTIEQELVVYGGDLGAKERWLVLNKRDLLKASDLDRRREGILERLGWQGPVFAISAVTGEGIADLTEALMRRLERERQSGFVDQPETEPDKASGGIEWHPLDDA
jgi:GTP-binding protein